MLRHARISILLSVVGLAVALAFPVTWKTGVGVTANEACAAQGGSCCIEDGSICYPGNGYPPVMNRYWRGDGLPCSAKQKQVN